MSAARDLYARGFDAFAMRLAEVWPGLIDATRGVIRLDELLERHVDGALYRASVRRPRATARRLVEAFLLRPEAWGDRAPAVVREVCPAAPVPETLRALAEGCREAIRHLEALQRYGSEQQRTRTAAVCRDLETLAAGLSRRALRIETSEG